MALFDIFKRQTSSQTAVNRLKFVLVSDRAGCSPEIMEQIKNDIIAVISKYIEMDTDGLDIKITQSEPDGDSVSGPAIIANIPIKEIRHGK